MAGTQRLLAIAMTILLPGNPGNANVDAVGMVLLADHARSGSQATAEGTTIYDGDRLSTDAEGSLRLRGGEALVYLPDKSCVTLHKGASGAAKEFEAELVSGTVVLSATAGTAAEIVVSSARIRPMAETRGVVQVGIAGPHELIVFARRGPAQISYRGETELIAEGKSYRVRLNDSDDGTPGEPGTKKSGRRGKALVLIVVGATAAAGVAALWGGNGGSKGSIESPDRPKSELRSARFEVCSQGAEPWYELTIWHSSTRTKFSGFGGVFFACGSSFCDWQRRGRRSAFSHASKGRTIHSNSWRQDFEDVSS